MTKHILIRASRTGCAILCLNALLCGTARADLGTTSSASISNIHFLVRDLTPHDGQAAGYRLLGTTTSLRTGAQILGPDGISVVSGDSQRWTSQWLAELSLDTVAGGAVSAATSGASALFATGDATAWLTGYHSSADSKAGDFNTGRGLEIAPHTEVTFVADWDLLASSQACATPDDCQRASSHVQFWFDGDILSWYTQYFSLETAANSPLPQALHKGGPFAVTLANHSDDWVFERVEMLAAVSGAWAPLPAVPEPASIALLGAGLAGIGWRAWRRRDETTPRRRAIARGVGLAAAVAALLGTAPAEAANSTAAIRNVQIQVQDLNPGDGQPAEYELTAATTGASARLTVGPGLNEGFWRDWYALGWFTPLRAEATLEGASTLVTTGADGLMASGEATGLLSGYSSSAQATLGAWGFDAGLRLAPHTSATITADWQLFAAIDGTCVGVTACEHANATAGFSWSGPLAPANGERFFLEPDYSMADPDPVQDSGTFTLRLFNRTDEWQAERLTFSASVLGNGPLPIPEPSTEVLLGLGLAGLAFRRCLRRS